ncbi:Histidinol dehydrogenase [Thermodesulfobacterium geofontis OPF15]|jgi:histidinol dehydrogenase|uniref:Histidinol dehydrogenase n=1 Tax=Thermodesulfobacterium geofontis (strain OPF15) TaxID=795359 RepID=F8C2C3_THEGP|nr:histidinol dehydrogenase [Thermodesulfobacterium geofontis]AEH23385.1 Histidinol dehydrogenase [Thermodesulfobacterium geofontis OPF15]
MKIRIFQYPSKKAERYLQKIVNRVEEFPKKIEKEVKKIGDRVKRAGDKALIEYTYKFDGVLLNKEDFKISKEEIERAYKEISPELFSAIKLAIEKVKKFHSQNLPQSWFIEDKGIFLGQMVKPVEKAGLYIPGGKGGETPLISTVIMTAVPAKIAGVEKIVMVSPPRKDKTLHPALLVAANEAGVDEIYKVGGPWSIFALAYGTETLPKVDIICGPGNIYVTTAKKIVSSFVGIDIIAGPSEVLIIADNTANPEFITYDLLAQAEHDPMSLSILITTSKKIAKEVKNLIPQALETGIRGEIAKSALSKRGSIIIVKDIETAFLLANLIAPEHLEIMVKDPLDYLPLVKNAGAVFLGTFTPEAIGDYLAGPNHVLPTMGFARFTSSLSAEKFLKKINFLKYSPSALKNEAKEVILLAETENLPFHAEAVKIRL